MDGVDKAFADTFGNYMLHGIEEVHLPASISWWPQTFAWKILGLLAIAGLSYWFFVKAAYWWRNRYRRQAIADLAALQKSGDSWQAAVAQLPILLKATALQAYPRDQVAQLSGQAWLAFLDAHYDGPRFCEATGSRLLQVAYQPSDQWQLSEIDSQTLLRMAQRWIKDHKPADHSSPSTGVDDG